MLFRQMQDEETKTFTYLVADTGTRDAIIIDPVKEHVALYIEQVEGLNLNLQYALDTHVHADHITGSGLLREKTGCKIAMSEETHATCVDVSLAEGDTIPFGLMQVEALYTPGHTQDHMSYLIQDRLFTGDCLFIGGCGRTDFQDGDPALLWASVTNKLFHLPPDTLVYPGHDYNDHHVSTIVQEQKNNLRFKGHTRQSFIVMMKNLKLPDPKKIHEAVPANEQCGLV